MTTELPFDDYRASHLGKGGEYHDKFSRFAYTSVIWDLEQRQMLDLVAAQFAEIDRPRLHQVELGRRAIDEFRLQRLIHQRLAGRLDRPLERLGWIVRANEVLGVLRVVGDELPDVLLARRLDGEIDGIGLLSLVIPRQQPPGRAGIVSRNPSAVSMLTWRRRSGASPSTLVEK